MARPLVRLADIPEGTALTLFNRNLDKSFRRAFRWAKMPIKGRLRVGPHKGSAVLMYNEQGVPIPFCKETLWRT